MLTNEQRIEICKAVARKFKNVSYLSRDDIEQEAMVAVLEAERSFQNAPSQDNLGGYANRAAQHAARWLVYRARSPLKHTDRARIGDEVAAIERVADDVLEGAVGDDLGPDDAFALTRWRNEVRGRFEALLGKDAEIDKTIARRLLLAGDDPAEIAADEAVPLAAVHVVAQRIRNRMRRDDSIIDLFCQM